VSTVSCSTVVPPSVRVAKARVFNDSNQNANFALEGKSTTAIRGNQDKEIDLLLTGNQEFQYNFVAAPGTGGLTVDIIGYYERR
jgi:hypothetical protein